MKYERELLGPVSRFLKRRGFGAQQKELPFYSHRIDLYAVSAAAGTTASVELKLSRWKKALRQASLYQLCADYVFVALPTNAATRAALDEFRAAGVGLIEVALNGRCRLVLEAQPSQFLVAGYRDSYVSMIRRGRNGRRSP